jgi:hypothetical protein
MTCVADVLNVVEAQNVGRKGSQASEDPGPISMVMAEKAYQQMLIEGACEPRIGRYQTPIKPTFQYFRFVRAIVCRAPSRLYFD